MPRLWPQAAKLENPVRLGADRLKKLEGSVSKTGTVFTEPLLVAPEA